MTVLLDPYTERPGLGSYRAPAPEAPRVGVELLSCSS